MNKLSTKPEVSREQENKLTGKKRRKLVALIASGAIASGVGACSNDAEPTPELTSAQPTATATVESTPTQAPEVTASPEVIDNVEIINNSVNRLIDAASRNYDTAEKVDDGYPLALWQTGDILFTAHFDDEGRVTSLDGGPIEEGHGMLQFETFLIEFSPKYNCQNDLNPSCLRQLESADMISASVGFFDDGDSANAGVEKTGDTFKYELTEDGKYDTNNEERVVQLFDEISNKIAESVMKKPISEVEKPVELPVEPPEVPPNVEHAPPKAPEVEKSYENMSEHLYEYAYNAIQATLKSFEELPPEALDERTISNMPTTAEERIAAAGSVRATASIDPLSQNLFLTLQENQGDEVRAAAFNFILVRGNPALGESSFTADSVAKALRGINTNASMAGIENMYVELVKYGNGFDNDPSDEATGDVVYGIDGSFDVFLTVTKSETGAYGDEVETSNEDSFHKFLDQASFKK